MIYDILSEPGKQDMVLALVFVDGRERDCMHSDIWERGKVYEYHII